ncbi:MAG: drug/metabolite transporter (DMT)-like permease [Oleispira sp.]|jgi:drug/metabolite transporter (DMT)-like permease
MKAVNVRRSAFWMSGAIMAFSLTAIAGREATHTLAESPLTVSQLLFFRNVIGLVLITVLILLRHGLKARAMLSSQSLPLHFGRNFAHFCGQWCWFYGLALLPIAHVFAIEFTVPIWTAMFASVILSESLTVKRMMSIILGFIGVLIILRPGMVDIESASWVVLLGAVAYALTHTLTKRLAGIDGTLTILFYMQVMQLPMALLLVVFDFAWPQGSVWLWVLLTAIAALSAHFCMAKALSLADAMIVMPMDFLRLPLIAVAGYVLYQESIDMFLLLGAVIMLLGNMLSLKEKPAISGPK